uniref:Uncharacterized protein n=1 Tax=Arundo donax TaxID=35708 RepID=A0A0A8YPC2_ARUDO
MPRGPSSADITCWAKGTWVGEPSRESSPNKCPSPGKARSSSSCSADARALTRPSSLGAAATSLIIGSSDGSRNPREGLDQVSIVGSHGAGAERSRAPGSAMQALCWWGTRPPDQVDLDPVARSLEGRSFLSC